MPSKIKCAKVPLPCILIQRTISSSDSFMVWPWENWRLVMTLLENNKTAKQSLSISPRSTRSLKPVSSHWNAHSTERQLSFKEVKPSLLHLELAKTRESAKYGQLSTSCLPPQCSQGSPPPPGVGCNHLWLCFGLDPFTIIIILGNTQANLVAPRRWALCLPAGSWWTEYINITPQNNISVHSILTDHVCFPRQVDK